MSLDDTNLTFEKLQVVMKKAKKELEIISPYIAGVTCNQKNYDLLEQQIPKKLPSRFGALSVPSFFGVKVFPLEGVADGEFLAFYSDQALDSFLGLVETFQKQGMTPIEAVKKTKEILSVK